MFVCTSDSLQCAFPRGLMMPALFPPTLPLPARLQAESFKGVSFRNFRLDGAQLCAPSAHAASSTHQQAAVRMCSARDR